MTGRKHYINIILRVSFLTLSALILGWLIFGIDNYIPAIFVVIVIISQFFELIHYLNSTNRKVAFFFDAVRNEDSTLNFPARTGSKSLNELNASLNKVNELIKDIKFELQQQEQYYKTILEHISIGIITYNERGTIFLSNTAARKLLNYEHLTHIDQILRIDKKLYTAFKELQPGSRKLASYNTKQEAIQLSLKSTLFKTANDNLQLVTIQDIKNELEAKELESWIKLIRVLTHEIMNTIAPITSLSQTLLGYYKSLNGNNPDDKIISNTIKGLEVINERGAGLMGFVDSYRKLTRLPQPDKKPISLGQFFERIILLSNTEHTGSGIQFKKDVTPADLEIYADPKQISQVLINLIKNSIEALKNSKAGEIILEGRIIDTGHPQITVSDNGCGIPDDLLDKIFIPFFTTKDSGSGIGLSLSRQIMQLHGGSLKIMSLPDKNTSAILTF